MRLIFFWTDFFTFLFLRNTKGVLINHVDTFLDIFVPQFSHYRIEVALIYKIAHCAWVLEYVVTLVFLQYISGGILAYLLN